MKNKQKTEERNEEKQERGDLQRVYDLSTPLWDKYYEKVRRNIRFPRYYNKAVNW